MTDDDRTGPGDIDLGHRVPAIRLPHDELLMTLAIRPFLQAVCRRVTQLRAEHGGTLELLLRECEAPARRRAFIHVPKGFAEPLRVDDIVRRDGP